MKTTIEFQCPKCEGDEGWGTAGVTQSVRHPHRSNFSRAYGVCHRCGFRWWRRDDYKHFVEIRRFKNRAEYKAATPPVTVKLFNVSGSIGDTECYHCKAYRDKMPERCTTKGYTGTLAPRCAGGRGCEACWAKWFEKPFKKRK